MFIYKISEFANIVGCSVKTLRYYDEIGLLIPDTTDEFTGYRYYSDNNIKDYQLIDLLKSVDFTLAEIIEHKNNISDTILKSKMIEIQERTQLLNYKYKKIALLRKKIQIGKVESENNQYSDDKKILVLRRKYEKRNVRKIA